MNFRKVTFWALAALFSGAVFFFLSSQPVVAGEKKGLYKKPRVVQNTTFSSFSSVKKALYRVIKTTAEKTFYCGCKFNPETREVDLNSCGYSVRKNEKRASRTEAEHIVPANRMCGETTHWKKGAPECVNKKGKPYKGRKCASKHHSVCKMAYHDLRNLKPAIGEINGDRSNYAFSELPGVASQYGKCDFIVHSKKKQARPAPDVRGDIARIYQFMALAYSDLFTLTLEEEKLFKKWSKRDPISREECRWNERLIKEQGAGNSVVEALCDKLANY